MIINEKIQVRVTKKNKEHYKNSDLNDLIMVYPGELMETSKALVCVECDNCKTKESIEYRKILTKRYDVGYFCRLCRKEINNIIFQDYTKTINYLLEDNFVYTKSGWIKISDMNETDLVYIYNNSETKLSSIKISNKEFSSYYNMKSNYIDFNFIDSHSFLIKNRNNIIDIKNRKELNNKDHFFFGFNNCYVNFDPNFILSDYIIPMNIWCKFMGIYLSEGSSSVDFETDVKNKVVITHKKKSTIIIIRELLNELPFIYKEYIRKDGTIDFIIIDNTLSEYLFQFVDSSSKFIPQNIKDTNISNINLFIDYLLLGDGRSRKVNGKLYRELYTTSIKLKDDLEFLFYKISSGCNINKQEGFIISESNKKGRYLDKRYINISLINENKIGYLIKTKIDGYLLIKSNDNCVFYSL